MNSKDYFWINVIFAVLLFCLFAGTYFNSDTDIISCQVLQKTGAVCSSCGLTRDFNAFVHLDFSTSINPMSKFVFGWFFLQFLLRIVILLIPPSKRQGVQVYDLTFTIVSGILIFVQFWL